MNILKKIRDTKNSTIQKEQKSEINELKDTKIEFDFEKFKEIIKDNTLLFDMGGTYFDTDGMVSQFQSKIFLQKEVQVNFRREKKDMMGEPKQIVVHLIDRDRNKPQTANTWIVCSKEGIEIGSYISRKTEPGQGLDFTYNESQKINFNEITNYLSKLDEDFVELWSDINTPGMHMTFEDTTLRKK